MVEAKAYIFPLDQRQFYEYYFQVKKPIWFTDIRKKMSDWKYKHRYELYKDLDQVCRYV